MADASELPSHRGTAVDGAVTLDGDGRVVPNGDLKRLFEYFLTGLGRASPRALRERLRAAVVKRGLPPDAVAGVLALFDRYLDYREALGELARPGTGADSLRAAYEARRQLRREVLGPAAAEGLFAREEAVDRHALEKRAIMGNDRLTAQQRQRRLALIQQQLPADVRRSRERARLALELRERTRALREAGAGEARIHALRQELVGAEAAQRLSELEQRRETWQDRLRAYRRERRRVAASPGLAPEDKAKALDRLLSEHFDEHEARRVKALQRIGANDGG
ncbi:hypothetical protein H0Z60_11590 [Ectothiorhodospiraceae bacterium WFHF3C12]|nr:hypothetical protein [Ectothiorhodospiraceae bacterium WFHF3C12]